MKKMVSLLYRSSNKLTGIMEWLSSLVLLGIRIYIFDVFFRSAWLKLASWEGTLALFRYEFKVWLISPEAAAVLGTAAELILPVFLVLGLGARLPVIALFIFNIISVISYPLLLTPEQACALKDHVLWGVLIAWIMFQGHGKVSFDYWIQNKFCKDYKY